MKKFILTLVALLGAIGLWAADELSHNPAVLPAAARSIISTNFKADISFVKIDKSFGRVSDYEAVLTDGSEVKFDRDGNWEEVETRASSSVPDYFVLKPIRDYIAKNHKGTRVVGIEKKRSGFDVELSNGLDMEFSRDGNFLRYDK